MTNIDTWFEEELRRGFVPFSTAAIPAGAPYRSPRHAPARPWFGARMATRTGVILVAATFALMATGALAAAAVTGTADPRAWTVHLTMAISSCTGQGATNQGGGIGGCLEAVLHYRGPKSFEPRARDGTRSTGQLAPPDAATAGDMPANVKKGGPASSPEPDPNALHDRPAGVPVEPPTDSPYERPSDVLVGPAATPGANPPTAQPTPQGRPTPPVKAHP